MHGTTNEQAFDAFYEGTRGFPVHSDEAFARSVGLFKRAIALDKRYARPRGWLAYAYVLSVNEGWRFDDAEPEAGWDEERRLKAADELSREAVALDETDYDTHWARANVLIHTRRWDEAIACFERALYLGRDEHNPSLLVDMADALVQVGEADRALDLIRKARRMPDWHHWVAAWACYAKARRDGVFYDLALDELRAMYWDPGEPKYLYDVKLLEAAIQARRAERQVRQGLGTGEAEQERAEAAFRSFHERPEFERWTLERARRFAPFRNPEDTEHWLEGCRAAGMKE